MCTGNDRLANKKFQEAIVSYSKAIDLNKSNAIYYSNRAAAYSHIGQHHKAIEDCKQAITIDPLYVKAYSRLGYVSRVTYVTHCHSLMLYLAWPTSR